jgi:hypothetical protein
MLVAGERDGADASDASGLSDHDEAAVDADAGAPRDAPRDEGYVRPARVLGPPAEVPDLSRFPRNDAGRIELLHTGEVRLELDPTLRDPVGALCACATLLSACYAPPRRSLDACVVSAPACATARPWEESAVCCPTACRDAYEDARRAGRTPDEALDEVFFQNPDCFPGVRAQLGGTP